MLKRCVPTGLILLTFVFFFNMPGAQALMLDLTTAGAEGSFNGAQFHQFDIAHVSPGQLKPFVRMPLGAPEDGIEQGYNTSGRTFPNVAPFDDHKDLTFTHDLKLSDLADRVVSIGGIDYYEFILNINQSQNTNKGQNLLSLDVLQIYQSNTGSLTTTAFDVNGHLPGLGTLVYEMGNDVTGGQNWIKLDSSLSPATAAGDMLAFIPTSDFNADQYVYLYSLMGEHYAANGGFEDWGLDPVAGPVVPEPQWLSFLSIGLLGLARLRGIKIW